MFFFKVNTTSCAAVNNIVSRFCNISGLMLNFQKSFVNFSPNTSIKCQQEYKTLLRMDSQSNLGTILGFRLIFRIKTSSISLSPRSRFYSNHFLEPKGFISIRQSHSHQFNFSCIFESCFVQFLDSNNHYKQVRCHDSNISLE